jgi:MATE family multidrug resistance protein
MLTSAPASTDSAPMPIGRHIRRTVSLALPVMISRAGLVILLFVSNMLLRERGVQEQASFAASLLPQTVLQTIGVGLLISTTVMTAQAMGAGRRLDGFAIWRRSLAIAACLGILYAALLWPGETLLNLLSQPADAIAGGASSMRVFGFGLPGLLMFVACMFFLEGINRPVPGMVVTLSANVVNAGLGWAMVNGAWGFPEMGQTGAVLAITVTRWLMFAAIMAYLLTMRDLPAFGFGGAGTHPAKISQGDGLKRQLRIGMPLALAIGLETSCFTAMVAIGGWISSASLATMNYAINYTSFVYMLTIGVSTAAAVRVGNAVGRENPTDLRRAGWIAVGMELAVMLMVAAITATFVDRITALYSEDPAVVPLLTQALSITAVLLVVDGLQGVLMGALRGAGDGKWPTLIYGVSFWAVGVPVAYIWAYRLGVGVPALMLALIIALSIALIGLGWRFHYISKHRLMTAA